MNEELRVVITAEIGRLRQSMQQAQDAVQGFATSSNGSISSFQTKIKKANEVVMKGVKMAAKGSGIIGGAIGSITVAAVKGFASYEQLSGGVEKLFGESADTIKSYAKEAYKTSGMTANQYMETVTSFSAGLISSMGGDTAAAAEVADMAINDMADNASIFGTSIDSIQNAYQGFAKGNYTMLDNLKLGYGGCQEEMERLLEDAEKISGIEYNIDSLDDVYNAIHVVQEEMEITGNAANESSKTIEGSIDSAKSAWSNLITGLATDEANIPELVQNVVDTSTNVIQNIIPIVKEVLDSIPEAISAISPEAGAAFQKILDFAKPIFDELKEVLKKAFDFVVEHWDVIVTIAEIIAGIAAAIAIVNGAMAAYNAVMAIAAAVTSPMTWIVIAVVAAVAALTAGVIWCYKNWDIIKEKVRNAVESMKTHVSNLKDSVCDKFNAIKDGISNTINKAKDAVKGAIDKIKSFFKFEWSLPKIKLPHFSIKGEFSLNPPSIPHFGVSWYARGGVFDKPSLFPYGNGSIGGLGEAGAEAVVPLEKNLKWLDKLADMLNDRMGNNNMVLMVDDRVLGEVTVGAINGITRSTGTLPLVLR